MIGVCFSGAFFCTGGFCGRVGCAGSFCFSSCPVRIWFWCASAARICRLTSRFSFVSAAISLMIFVCSVISVWISRETAVPVFCLRQDLWPFLCKLASAFPDLADTVKTFLCIREDLEVLFVKFVAVPALEDEVDLCLLDYLVFAALRFLHNYTILSHPCGKKELWFFFHSGSPEQRRQNLACIKNEQFLLSGPSVPWDCPRDVCATCRGYQGIWLRCPLHSQFTSEVSISISLCQVAHRLFYGVLRYRTFSPCMPV